MINDPEPKTLSVAELHPTRSDPTPHDSDSLDASNREHQQHGCLEERRRLSTAVQSWEDHFIGDPADHSCSSEDRAGEQHRSDDGHRKRPRLQLDESTDEPEALAEDAAKCWLGRHCVNGISAGKKARRHTDRKPTRISFLS